MSVHSSLHFTLYGKKEPRVGLRLNNGAALLEIDTHEEGSRGGFCVSGPPDRVLRVIEAVASLAVQCRAAVREANEVSARSAPKDSRDPPPETA